MKDQAKRVLLIATGWVLVVVGIIGWIVPLMHGTTFVIAGLIILSKEYVWADNMLKKVRAKAPRISAFVDRCHAKLVSLWTRAPEASGD